MTREMNIDAGGDTVALVLGLHDRLIVKGKRTYQEFGSGVNYYQTLWHVASTFCLWAYEYVDFEKAGECWPYLCEGEVADKIIELEKECRTGDFWQRFNEDDVKQVLSCLNIDWRE